MPFRLSATSPPCGNGIRDEINGVVVSALDSTEVAAALMRALGDDAIVQAAKEENERLVLARADYQRNMRDVESQYEMLARGEIKPHVGEEAVGKAGPFQYLDEKGAL